MAAFAEAAELSSCDKALMVCKTRVFTITPLRKKFGDFDLEKYIFLEKVNFKMDLFETECH